jgi:hypothetical protein
LNYKPPVYTPFLRRFTDEPARELSDTIALYNEVRAAYCASAWAHAEAIERVSAFIASSIGEVVDLPNDHTLAVALDRCQTAVLALETTIFSSPKINWDIARLSMKEQVDLRRFPHEDGKGFNVMLQALPLHDNGKIVLREHEPKEHEGDEPSDARRQPARGRNDGDRNAPRDQQRR